MWKSDYKKSHSLKFQLSLPIGGALYFLPHNHDLKANKNALKANQNRGHETLPVFSAVNSWIAVSMIL